jgi:hypothetical protein
MEVSVAAGTRNTGLGNYCPAPRESVLILVAKKTLVGCFLSHFAQASRTNSRYFSQNSDSICMLDNDLTPSKVTLKEIREEICTTLQQMNSQPLYVIKAVFIGLGGGESSFGTTE